MEAIALAVFGVIVAVWLVWLSVDAMIMGRRIDALNVKLYEATRAMGLQERYEPVVVGDDEALGDELDEEEMRLMDAAWIKEMEEAREEWADRR
jgi:hypothetical protein